MFLYFFWKGGGGSESKKEEKIFVILLIPLCSFFHNVCFDKFFRTNWAEFFFSSSSSSWRCRPEISSFLSTQEEEGNKKIFFRFQGFPLYQQGRQGFLLLAPKRRRRRFGSVSWRGRKRGRVGLLTPPPPPFFKFAVAISLVFFFFAKLDAGGLHGASFLFLLMHQV